MAESVDALVSNTSGAIRAGSTPAQGTTRENPLLSRFYLCRRAGRVYPSGTSGAIRAGSTPAQGIEKRILVLRVLFSFIQTISYDEVPSSERNISVIQTSPFTFTK